MGSARCIETRVVLDLQLEVVLPIGSEGAGSFDDLAAHALDSRSMSAI